MGSEMCIRDRLCTLVRSGCHIFGRAPECEELIPNLRHTGTRQDHRVRINGGTSEKLSLLIRALFTGRATVLAFSPPPAVQLYRLPAPRARRLKPCGTVLSNSHSPESNTRVAIRVELGNKYLPCIVIMRRLALLRPTVTDRCYEKDGDSMADRVLRGSRMAVSYTHLTLPTSYSV